MERKRTMAPSVYARAAVLRRAQARRRALLAKARIHRAMPTMQAARDALELAWAESQRGEDEVAVRPIVPMPQPNLKPRSMGHDEFGAVFARGITKDYRLHYRMVGKRLADGRIKRYRVQRKDAWARERSPELGHAKVAELVAERTCLYLRAENVTGVGSGTYAEVWTATGNRPEWKDRGHADLSLGGDAPSDESLWAERWGVIDGLAYRFRFNRATGEMRRA